MTREQRHNLKELVKWMEQMERDHREQDKYVTLSWSTWEWLRGRIEEALRHEHP